MQLSLLDQLAPSVDRGFGSVSRHKLGLGAWVDYAPEWLSGHHEVMDELIRTATWERHRREMYDRVVDVPRLVAGVPGTVGGGGWEEQRVETFQSPASEAEIVAARDRVSRWAAHLSMRYGRVLDSISLAYYRDGLDSIAFHGDKMGALRSDTVVAIVSVGAPRHFHVRRAGGGPVNCSFRFGGGDLLVMGGTCQQEFEHAVPKMKNVGPRIALVFRERIPEVKNSAGVLFQARGASRTAVA